MDKVRRILVHVCTDRAAPQPAHFLQVTFWITASMSECVCGTGLSLSFLFLLLWFRV